MPKVDNLKYAAVIDELRKNELLPKEIAEKIGCTREYVYVVARQHGIGFKLGKGSKPRTEREKLLLRKEQLEAELADVIQKLNKL